MRLSKATVYEGHKCDGTATHETDSAAQQKDDPRLQQTYDTTKECITYDILVK